MPEQNDLQQRIRERAYQLWIEDGRPEGKENVHWERARMEIEAVDKPDVAISIGSVSGS